MAGPFKPRFADLVRNYTDTAGTEDFVLGAAVAGFTGIADALRPGDQFYYSAIGVEKPSESEVGRGELLAGGLVRRDPASGVKTDFTTGLKSIALVAPALWFEAIEKVRAEVQPIIVSDFKNGVHTLNGEPVAYEDLWQPAVGPAIVVPGIGWTFTASGAGGNIYSPATEAVNQAVRPAAGFTVVMDCSINTPDIEGSRSVMVGLSAYNPAEDKFATAAAYHDPPSWGGSGGEPPYASTTDGSAFQYITLGNIHRFAANLGPGGEAISVGGGSVRTSPATYWGDDISSIFLESVVENSGIKPQTVVVERVLIYPLMDADRLPGLSARSLPTPANLAERIALARVSGSGVVIAQNAEPKSLTGTTAETVLATVKLPANSMGSNGRLAIDALFSHSSNTNGKTPRIRFGGTNFVWGFTVTSNTSSSSFGNVLHNRGSHSVQAFLSPGALGPYTRGSSSPVVITNIDSSQDVDITFTGQLDVPTDTIALESFQVVLFPSN